MLAFWQRKRTRFFVGQMLELYMLQQYLRYKTPSLCKPCIQVQYVRKDNIHPTPHYTRDEPSLPNDAHNGPKRFPSYLARSPKISCPPPFVSIVRYLSPLPSPFSALSYAFALRSVKSFKSSSLRISAPSPGS